MLWLETWKLSLLLLCLPVLSLQYSVQTVLECVCARAFAHACVLHEQVDFINTVCFLSKVGCMLKPSNFFIHITSTLIQNHHYFFVAPYIHFGLDFYYFMCLCVLPAHTSVCHIMPDAPESDEPPRGCLHSFLHISTTVPILRQSDVFWNVFAILVLFFKS